MKNRHRFRRCIMPSLLLAAGIAACGHDDDPIKPVNHNPVIFSLTVFPTAMGPQDSAIIVCNAMDPDAYTLLYDWITDADLRIKGSQSGVYLFNSLENSQVLYYGAPNAPLDTAYIECTVHDRRGGGVVRNAALVLTP